MIDVQDFKRINDGYGHAEGDRCLREVAKAIGGAVRKPDAVLPLGRRRVRADPDRHRRRGRRRRWEPA